MRKWMWLLGVVGVAMGSAWGSPGVSQGGRAPWLDKVVDLTGEAKDIEDVGRLLAAQLEIPVVVSTGGGEQAKAGGSARGGIAGGQVRLVYHRRPITEVLDRVTDAFGYTWCDVGGVCLVRRARGAIDGRLRSAAQAIGGRAPAWRPEALASMLSREAHSPSDGGGIPVGSLASGTQAEVWRLLAAEFGRQLGRGVDELATLSRLAQQSSQIGYGEFVGAGQIRVGGDQRSWTLQVGYPVPGAARTTRLLTWQHQDAGGLGRAGGKR